MSAPAGAEVDLLLRCWALDARGHTLELRRALEPIPIDRLLTEPELGLLLARAYIATLEPARAGELTARLAPVLAERGDDRQRRRLLNLDAQVLLHQGRLGEAEERLRRLEAESAAAGDRLTRFYAWSNLGILAALRCDFDAALGWLGRATAVLRQLHARRWGMPLHQSLGRANLEMGRPAEAERHFQRAARYAGSAHETAVIHLERAILKAQTGDLELAEAMATDALEHFQTHGIANGIAQAHRALGVAALERSDWAAARSRFAEALAALPAGEPLLAAEVHEGLALAWLRLGGAAASARHAAEAGRLYDEMEAPRRRERMEQRLRAARPDPP